MITLGLYDHTWDINFLQLRTIPVLQLYTMGCDSRYVTTSELKWQSVLVFCARLASLGHLGLISKYLTVSKFHTGIHYPKGQQNKIYTIKNESDQELP